MSTPTTPNPALEDLRRAELQKISSQVAAQTTTCLAHRNVPMVVQLAEKAEAQADQFFDRILSQAEVARANGQEIPTLDCKKGCDYCCTVRVVATPIEVIRIANHVENNFSQDEKAALVARISTYETELLGLKGSSRFQKQLACPMLIDGACSVHTARPLACRAHHSTDVNACRRAKEGEEIGVPGFRDIGILTGAIIAGLQTGISLSQKIGQRVKMPESVKIALENPAAAQKWLDGTPIFPREENVVTR